MKITEIIEMVSNTPSTTDKKQILIDNMSETLKQVFIDTYNDKKYHIKKFSENYDSGNTLFDLGCLTIDNNYEDFRVILNKLSNREVTGKAAQIVLENALMQFTLEDRKVLEKIVLKNLKIGITATVFAQLADVPELKKFPVALANKIQDYPELDVLDGSWYVSRKLDGVRCLGFVDTINNTVEFRSRQNKVYDTLDNLKHPVLHLLASLPKGKYVLDGECCIVDENGNENFVSIMDEIKEKDHTIENPNYKIFDLLEEDEFWGKKASKVLSERFDRLYNALIQYDLNFEDEGMFEIIAQANIKSQEELDYWINEAKENKWEGLMIRKNIPYEGKRSKYLLKMKKYQDAEFRVDGLTTGKMTYREEDGTVEYNKVVTALEIHYKGNPVFVGSGLSKQQRINWALDPKSIIGKTITVQYFAESVNKKTGEKSLRFPTLKYVYENGRDC